MVSSPVVTRFAPSPTGFLHIGGARTALFNWLFARKHGGKMLLRIEDTDRARSSVEATQAIIDGLDWLGLGCDGDPISQFGNVKRHRQVAQDLLESGKAYKCFATPEELNEMRETAKAEGRSMVYDGRWRDRDPSEAPEGAPFVIRIKAPYDGSTIIDDQVQGKVEFANKDLDDLVLLRSDGTPTYMLAVVVDDHDMGVTHIIRGDDHLTNAGRQALIYAAMGWDIPVMAHIPLIHGPDGAKLSKRHGALGVEAYRDMGYLQAALRNYLVKLGWAHGDEEIISEADMIKWFGFDGMNKAAARFDFQKLEALNGHYIREEDEALLLERLMQDASLFEGGEDLLKRVEASGPERLVAALPALKERAKTMIELVAGAEFLYAKVPLVFEDRAKSALDDAGLAAVKGLRDPLAALTEWNKETVEGVLRAYAEEHDLKFGKVAQPLRATLTGKNTSPGVFDCLVALGQKESIARIEDQI